MGSAWLDENVADGIKNDILDVPRLPFIVVTKSIISKDKVVGPCSLKRVTWLETSCNWRHYRVSCVNKDSGIR